MCLEEEEVLEIVLSETKKITWKRKGLSGEPEVGKNYTY